MWSASRCGRSGSAPENGANPHTTEATETLTIASHPVCLSANLNKLPPRHCSLFFDNDKIPWFQRNCLLWRNRSLCQQIGTGAVWILECLYIARVIKIIVNRLAASIYSVFYVHRRRKLLIG